MEVYILLYAISNWGHIYLLSRAEGKNFLGEIRCNMIFFRCDLRIQLIFLFVVNSHSPCDETRNPIFLEVARFW